jgi:hypothetical protein
MYEVQYILIALLAKVSKEVISMNNIESLRTKWTPRKKTGKTQFNRGKARGESWTKLRSQAWGEHFVCTEKWVK